MERKRGKGRKEEGEGGEVVRGAKNTCRAQLSKFIYCLYIYMALQVLYSPTYLTNLTFSLIFGKLPLYYFIVFDVIL